LEESRWLDQHIGAETYTTHYGDRVENSVYRPIIDELLIMLGHVNIDMDYNKISRSN
jgi:hypothetical protein